MYSPIDLIGLANALDTAFTPLRGPILPWKSNTTLFASVKKSGFNVEALP